MTIGNPSIGAAPPKSVLSHTVDIPFVVNLEDPDNPYIEGTPTGFHVEGVYELAVLQYWKITLDYTFYKYLSLTSTLRIAVDQAAASLGFVESTVPETDSSERTVFNFFVKGSGVSDPTNYDGVCFLLRVTTWSF